MLDILFSRNFSLLVRENAISTAWISYHFLKINQVSVYILEYYVVGFINFFRKFNVFEDLLMYSAEWKNYQFARVIFRDDWWKIRQF